MATTTATITITAMITVTTTTITATIVTTMANATASAGFRAIRIMATTIPDAPRVVALLRLMTWMSPAFPVGGFSYSHGLEHAVEEGRIRDAGSLTDWLTQLIEIGSARNDAVLFVESWRRARNGGDLAAIATLGEALAASSERHRETMLQGAAFLKAIVAWPHDAIARLPDDCPYCVAAGAVAGAHEVALEDALGAFMQAFVSNLTQASIRLGVVGQSDAVAMLARLEPLLLATARRAAASSLADLGSATILSDIMAMRHETQYSRIFRS